MTSTFFAHELSSELGQSLVFPLDIAIFQDDILSFAVTELAQPLLEIFQMRLIAATYEKNSESWNSMVRLRGCAKRKEQGGHQSKRKTAGILAAYHRLVSKDFLRITL